MRKVLQIILAIAAIALAYLLYESIMEPIRFDKERKKRYEATVERLKDIRKAQVAFKDVYNRYTGSFDTLINFINTDSMPVVKALGNIPEEYIDSLKSRKKAEQLALKRGIIRRDTIRISIKDTLFGENYKIEKMQFIPFTDNKKFEMATGTVMASGLPIKVFEAKALSKVILHGLDEKLIITYNDGKDYAGLKVGSISEANNNAGNWE